MLGKIYAPACGTTKNYCAKNLAEARIPLWKLASENFSFGE